MEKHAILSRYMLSRNVLAPKVYWSPSVVSPPAMSTCPSTPAPPSYLLLWVERSLIRMAPPSLCSSISRGSASTFCRGSGIPTASWEQGTVDSWASTRESPPHALLPRLTSYLSLWLCRSLQLRNGLPHRAQHTLAQLTQPCHFLKHAHRDGVQGQSGAHGAHGAAPETFVEAMLASFRDFVAY